MVVVTAATRSMARRIVGSSSSKSLCHVTTLVTAAAIHSRGLHTSRLLLSEVTPEEASKTTVSFRTKSVKVAKAELALERQEATRLSNAMKKKTEKKPKTKKSAMEQLMESECDDDALVSSDTIIEKMQYSHLPSRDQWKEQFPISRSSLNTYRLFLSNRESVQKAIAGLGIDEIAQQSGNKVTIIEGYPGPGIFTSELIKHPQVEKVIALEHSPPFYDMLKNLESLLISANDGSESKLSTINHNAYEWSTYNQLIDSGSLSHLENRIPFSKDGEMVKFSSEQPIPPTHDDLSWKTISPIIYLAQLPNTVHGEQLFAQIMHAIASRLWLFRYGRIRLGFVCCESLARRCLAQPGERMSRGKLGTTVQSLADVQLHLSSEDLLPHSHHFFPPKISVGPRVPVSSTALIPNSNSNTGLSKTGMCFLTITPKAEPLVKRNEIEAFEFITRNLYVLRAKTVGEALTHVAPGAQNVLKMMTNEKAEQGIIRHDEVVDPATKVVDLTNVQWACLARTFEKWPFRPQHLFEEGRIQTDRHKKK